MTNHKPTFADTGERNVLKLAQRLQDYFSPKIIGEVNDVYIKVAKMKGEDTPWHTHDDEDELFYVLKGKLRMFLESQEPFDMNEGEFFIVQRGVKHRVSSDQDCWTILIENKTTKHLGNVKAPHAKSIEDQF
ncbi:MAG: cupin domain-containing protein [Candidatus Zixiibacteriota bacterium]|nr:MAG: cupin domain-containing protein [candidate division Zixibacteria bacterium]